MSQKVIVVGNSSGIVLPKPFGFLPGQDVELTQENPDRIVIERKSKASQAKSADLVKWAAAYVERYRQDFEALADK
jgi:antitoxin component of MazEF toxin-antitoxin module